MSVDQSKRMPLVTSPKYVNATCLTFFTNTIIITAFYTAAIIRTFLTLSVLFEVASMTAQATLSIKFTSVTVWEILLAARAAGW